jgi:6-pyruvoyltetrahydropterin/6-carboxytetrahydropterin synthase
MLTVTKRFKFDAAHQLKGYEGDCGNVHGHTYTVDVTFYQPRDRHPGYQGMVIDFKDIKLLVNPIIEQLDHALINDFIAPPTAENIVIHIVHRILKTSIGDGLYRVRVWEGLDSYAEYTLPTLKEREEAQNVDS